MAKIDIKKKVINGKIVYYGPGLCGKTTNLEYINRSTRNSQEMMSLSTEGDRTIFFDFLPMDLGKIRGISTKFKLYTVPGQVRYNLTRKMVLKNVDGVVFVADSQPQMMDSNIESLENLFDNLRELRIDPNEIPLVLQYNKRDLPNVMPPEEMDKIINSYGYPTYMASAMTGEGVHETLKKISALVFKKFSSAFGDVAQKKAAAQAAAAGTPPIPPGAADKTEDKKHQTQLGMPAVGAAHAGSIKEREEQEETTSKIKVEVLAPQKPEPSPSRIVATDKKKVDRPTLKAPPPDAPTQWTDEKVSVELEKGFDAIAKMIKEQEKRFSEQVESAVQKIQTAVLGAGKKDGGKTGDGPLSGETQTLLEELKKEISALSKSSGGTSSGGGDVIGFKQEAEKFVQQMRTGIATKVDLADIRKAVIKLQEQLNDMPVGGGGSPENMQAVADAVTKNIGKWMEPFQRQIEQLGLSFKETVGALRNELDELKKKVPERSGERMSPRASASVKESKPAVDAAPAKEATSAVAAAPVKESKPAVDAAPVKEAAPDKDAAPEKESVPSKDAARAKEEAPEKKQSP